MEANFNITDKRYEFTRNSKLISFVLIAIGLISVIASFATNSHQTWSNLLANDIFFLTIALGGLFFLAIQYASEVGWSIGIRRIPEAIAMYLPWGAALTILILVGNYITGQSSGHFLYHWWHYEYFNPESPEFDHVIAGKSGFLNMPFFMIRVAFYFAVWVGYAFYFRKLSVRQDNALNGTELHLKMRSASYVFLVLFAITSSLMAWDFIMSIDTHWYSTLFGWYTFSSLFVGAIAVIAVAVGILKRRGLMDHVNEHHLQNIGLFLFAFSIFWTYLWFSQFMLIWYSNIPEEVSYFMVRQDHYRIFWITTFFVNFVAPILILMTRDAKRKSMMLIVMGVLVFIGHWMDFFQMITPGVVGAEWHLGWMEIGTALGFFGLFRYVMLNEIAKSAMFPRNDPFMEESLQHTL
ncbi:MAG: quinol:cytochrome C oxidoreductase [Bacteroidia bacterium]|nr:quinol:cytochrome C oxidoreductase [Bacteroidia bacterium]